MMNDLENLDRSQNVFGEPNVFAPNAPNGSHTSLTNPPRLRKSVYTDDVRPRQYYQYSEYFKDSAEQMGEMITGLSTRPQDDQSFLITKIFPMKSSRDMTITWNKFHFNDGIAQITPEEGVSHVLTYQQSAGFESVQRYGISLRGGDLNALATAGGQQLLGRQVKQAVLAINRAMETDAILTLMSTDQYDYEDAHFKYRGPVDWQHIIALKNEETLCLNKPCASTEQKPFLAAVDRRKALLRERGFDATDLIMCRGAETYLHGLGEDNDYAKAGPAGPRRANMDMYTPINSYRGLAVHYLREFVLQKNRPATDFLSSYVVGGEFYRLKPNQQEITIYDWTNGRKKKLSRNDVIAVANEIEANLVDDNNVACPNVFENNTPVNDNNTEFLICRPAITVLTGSAIMCHAGAALGSLYINPDTNFVWGFHHVDQTAEASFIYWSKAVLHEPRCVTHMKHILAKGYIGGGGVKPMMADDLKVAQGNDWYFNSTSGAPSWFAIRILAEDAALGNNRRNDIVIPKSIALSGEFSNDIRTDKHFIAKKGLRKKYGWSEAVQLGELGNYYNLQLDSGGLNPVKCPLVLSEGWHMEGDEVIPGSSFLGRNVYPGAENVLNGIKPVFEMQKYS